jgi:signal recognition particle GTPase
MTVETKKYKLIEKITSLQDEEVLNKLELLLKEYSSGNAILMEIVKPMREELDIEKLKLEQNYKGFNKEEVDQLIKEIDIQEPIEDLLRMV